MSDAIRPAGSGSPNVQSTGAARPASEARPQPTKEQIESFVTARRDSLVDGLLKQGLIKEEHATAMKAAPLDQWTNVFHGFGGGGGWGHGGGWGPGPGWGHGGGGGWGHGGGGGWGHGGGGGWGHGGGGGWGHGGAGGWGHR